MFGKPMRLFDLFFYYWMAVGISALIKLSLFFSLVKRYSSMINEL